MNRTRALTVAALMVATSALPAQAAVSMNGCEANAISLHGKDVNGISRTGVDASGVTLVAIEPPPASE